jgi:dTDP-4-dehydrorhamnose reductase
MPVNNGKRRIVITGSSGFIGSEIYRQLDTPKYFNDLYVVPLKYRMDISEQSQVVDILSEARPDIIIHLAGVSSPDICEINQEHAYNINYLGTKHIVDYSASIGCKLVYASTDYVFDGDSGPYRETTTQSPINYYGRTKVLGEKYILNNHKENSSIIRIPIVYGAHEKSFVNQIIIALAEKKNIYLNNTQIRYPIFCEDLASYFVKVVVGDHSGILHIPGLTGITKYAWGKYIASIVKREDYAIRINDVLGTCEALRPRDCNLVSNNGMNVNLPCRNVFDGTRFYIKKHSLG